MSDVIYFGYSSQIDFIDDFLCNYLDDNEALIIRMHPNMTNVIKLSGTHFTKMLINIKRKMFFG